MRYIKKEEANIRKIASISSRNAKRVVKTQNKTMEKMENALSVWIQDCRQKKISLDTNMNRAKAKSLYDDMVPEGDDISDDEGDPRPSTSSQTSPQPGGFVASKCRFDKFKK